MLKHFFYCFPNKSESKVSVVLLNANRGEASIVAGASCSSRRLAGRALQQAVKVDYASGIEKKLQVPTTSLAKLHIIGSKC